ncbi:Na+/H+ antiporter subunit E [Nisaea acidiphila]|uniref:Na+/H+ antiporter subunit E n=1 Tax=Nisaea acidiphila TaxID=1862145 RepID=A0A9J7AUP1_9PROT|nr:Na+/H+ antiporter subunit E [Nisaea acidiphila]UUX50036.1 Na+/H+ antiporter subunit E [Nisaea acidiphila]
MGHIISLGVSLAAFWMLLSGSVSLDHKLVLGFGVASVVLTVFLALRMDRIDGNPVSINLRPRLIRYWIWLAKEIGKANIDVAKIVLSTKLEISPRMVRVKATQKTDVGIATFANSITLTPGTVTVDIEDDEILVHAITNEMAEGLLQSDMDDRITAVEARIR